MPEDDLQPIIQLLEAKAAKHAATFGILEASDPYDGYFIKANKEGLLCFALELLKAAQKSGQAPNNDGKSFIPIEFEQDWLNTQSDVSLRYVDLISFREPVQSPYKRTIRDRLLEAGCLAVAVLLIICLFIGAWTLGSWLF